MTVVIGGGYAEVGVGCDCVDDGCSQWTAEGEIVLRALLRSRWHEPVSLLIAAQRVAGLAPLLATVAEGVPIYAASQAALDGIVGFPLHRGILALGRRMPTADIL